MTRNYTTSLFAPAATWPTTGDGAVHALLFLRSFTTGHLLAQMQVEWLLTGGPWRMLRIIRAGLRFLAAKSVDHVLFGYVAVWIPYKSSRCADCFADCWT